MASYDLDDIPARPSLDESSSVQVQAAACVIALRGSPFEILLIRRHRNSAFLPDVWVFPGERLENQDLRDNELATMQACAVRELQEETGLTIVDLHSIVCTARWITPPGVHKRFDTWFFLAAVPDDAEATADQIEGTEVLWIKPREALTQHANSALSMVLPTRRNLEAIAEFSNARELIESRRNAPLRTIRPQIVTDGGKTTVILPD